MDGINIQKKNYDLLDLVKLILSFMVVAIHSGLFDPYLFPWLRLAVPMFFLISSYFFFTKVRKCETTNERLVALKDFVLRNAKLYLFWLIALSPVIVLQRRVWFAGGILEGLLNVFLNLFIGSTFVASWFISALIIGTVIIFFASRKINNLVLFIVGVVLYVLIAIRSSYMVLFKDMTDVLLGVLKYESYMNSPVNSFPAGLFWIICGKIFADGGVKVKLKPSIVALCISLALLFTEWLLAWKLLGSVREDFYIMLLPACLSLFNVLLNVKPISLKYAKEMRKISTVTFASHGAVLFIIHGLFEVLLPLTLPSVVKFISTVAICFGISMLIFFLEKFKYLKWLKYSH